MTDSALPANSMASGQNIATFDPLLTRPKKKLRDILKSEVKKDKGNGI